ncbi:MAG: hypothetical protein ABSC25_20150 [Roseiarcus sp.]|jgi:hypothetical protein
MKILRFSLALLATLLAAACGHMPVSTMIRLRSFDLTTIDPLALRVAVRTPDALAPRPDGVKLVVASRIADEPPRREAFVLKPALEAAELAQLDAFAAKGAAIAAYRLDPADAPRVKALQAEGVSAKAEHPGRNNFTISIGAEACRRAPLPDGQLLLTTYLRPDEQTGYLVFLKDIDLRQEASATDKTIEEWTPPCEADAPIRP